MASIRGALAKGSVVVGVSSVTVAVYTRRQRDHGNHRTCWSEGLSTRLYRTFAAPVLFQLDPETAHNWSLGMGQVWQAFKLLAEPSWTGATPVDWLFRPVSSASSPSGPSLRQNLFDGRLSFDSPVGIAAGYDKNALLVPLYRTGALGLGFGEVGSVSALPSDGNPKPRCIRLVNDDAVINRMGLNGEGCEIVARRLQDFAALGGPPNRAPVGVNIAKTHATDIFGEAAIQDFATSYRTLAPLADFVVLNVSCPNTADGKTFEEPDSLRELLQAIAGERQSAASSPPVLVKLSPPSDVITAAGSERLRGIVEVAKGSGIVHGFVVSNTAGDRELKLTDEGKEAAAAFGKGGLSGRPIFSRSTAAIRQVYAQTGGSMPIIGVGGIDSAEAAYAKIRAGASLIEIYTGLVYKGPGLLSDIHMGLRKLLERDGFGSISEAVGADVRT